MYMTTGNTGVPLRDIIKSLGDKSYKFVEFRIYYDDEDMLFGGCSYEDGKLIPLDGDYYSLDDLYVRWEEWSDGDELCLTVWEDCILEPFEESEVRQNNHGGD